MITIGFPAYFPLPSGVTGGTNPIPFGLVLYNPTYAVANATGMVDASSYEMFEGI